MDINGWLTVMTVFLAIFAILPSEDLQIVLHKTYLIEKIVLVFVLVFLIPYLIYFYQLSQYFSFLQNLTITDGFEPTNLAFLIFFITFLWFVIRLFILKPNKKPTIKTIGYYKELLNEKTFDEFFSIFTKHISPKEIKGSWDLYREIFFQQKFLNGIFNNRTSYLLNFWGKFNNEEDFKLIFRLYLENENSDYYNEIKEHWNSNSLMENMPFLNKVINKNIKNSIDNHIVDIIYDYTQKHLKFENKILKLYNQKHYYPRIRQDYGMDLPIYYHVRFIGFLHTTIIKNKIKTGGRTLSLFSEMIKEMLNNVNVRPDIFDNEYPTNYHWLIGEICATTQNWVNNFGKKYYNNKSGYNQFIPYSFWLIVQSLIEGFDKGVISEWFINRMVYHHMLSSYFDLDMNEEFKIYIEDEFIAHIPEGHLQQILDFTLNEKFAIKYYKFKTGKFGIIEPHENKNVKRLYDYLKKNNMLW